MVKAHRKACAKVTVARQPKRGKSARVSQQRVPAETVVVPPNTPVTVALCDPTRRRRVTRAMPSASLPRAWSSPPSQLIKHLHAPPATVHCFLGGLDLAHHVNNLSGWTHEDDKDVFVIAALPNMLDVPSRPLNKRDATRPCSEPLRRRLAQVLQDVRADLGSVDGIPMDALFVAALVLPHSATQRHDSPCRSRWQVAGIVLARELSCAYRVHAVAQPVEATSVDSAPPATQVGDVWCTGTSLCGVQLMWVAESWRGRGIAFAMVEESRHRVCYGHSVSASLVAFSEPTQLGAKFARRYAGRNDFLVF